VNVKILIGVDGKTKSVQAVDGPAILRESAIDAVKRWEYTPYLINGHPVEVTTEVPINFKP
jgi:protein TonB